MSALTWDSLGDWSPLPALQHAQDAQWLIDDVVPLGGITWMVAAPESFKTFIALDMASCVAKGQPWKGRGTRHSVVLYLAAEGGNDVHVRRAAADIANGGPGYLRIVQMRPRLDEGAGLGSLIGLAYGVTGPTVGIKFPDAHAHFMGDLALSYLSADEQSEFERRLQCEDDALVVCVSDYAEELARPRYNAFDKAMAEAIDLFLGSTPQGLHEVAMDLFLVIDTFSQTSADDTKATVSKYIKNLRDLQDRARELGATVTVMVVDHTTKSGDSYMGSLAKEGDSDAMLEVDRHGDSHGATVKCAKMKVARPFDPIHLEMKVQQLDGFTDAKGRPLSSLVVTDGTSAHRLRKAVGADSDTAAAVLLGVIESAENRTEPQLRQAFASLPTNEGKNADSLRRAFRRAMATLEASGNISVSEDGVVSVSLA
jgi:hypothetical protein